MTTLGTPRSAQRGATLIEVLVSLTLVAVTMLGLLGLQLRSISFQKDSADRRTAAFIAADFAERVAANFRGFASDRFAARTYVAGGTLPSVPSCGSTTACTEVQVADRDFAHLAREVTNRLPGGSVYLNTVRLNGADTFVSNVQIVVAWVDPQREQSLSPALTGSARIDATCSLPFVAITDVSYRCYLAAVYP